MIQLPNINPIIVKLGSIKIYWYGVMYLIGFVAAWILAAWRAKKSNGIWTSEEISDLIFYCIIGVLLGGRIGYIIFYNLSFYLIHPLEMFKVWDGGMSFHGGLIGVMTAFFIFSRKTYKGFFQISDFIAPMVPIGLGAGRIGNFINGELWGKVSTLPWSMIFPKDPLQLPRQPSELYEFILEGVVLFIILWFYSKKARPRMAISGYFLLLYGCFRFWVEFVRLPDPQLGYLAWGWLTMGQLLSIPMIIFGIILIMMAYTKHKLVDGMNVDDMIILKKLKQQKT